MLDTELMKLDTAVTSGRCGLAEPPDCRSMISNVGTAFASAISPQIKRKFNFIFVIQHKQSIKFGENQKKIER